MRRTAEGLGLDLSWRYYGSRGLWRARYQSVAVKSMHGMMFALCWRGWGYGGVGTRRTGMIFESGLLG